MVTDRVGDFIVRLQNAALVSKPLVTVPYSGHVLAIAKKLKELGFVASVEVKAKDDIKKEILVTLVYTPSGKARLRGVKRISKPGRRLYKPHAVVHKVKGGTGARLLSTSLGILSDTEVRSRRVGGEDLFEIW